MKANAQLPPIRGQQTRPPVDPEAPLCPVHQKPMRKRQGKFGSFWSSNHKEPNGKWCTVTKQIGEEDAAPTKIVEQQAMEGQGNLALLLCCADSPALSGAQLFDQRGVRFIVCRQFCLGFASHIRLLMYDRTCRLTETAPLVEDTVAKFDIAISFAGEQRELAGALAERLDAAGYSAFFDEYYEAELWGSDLTISIGEVYAREARWCLVIVSHD